MATNTSVKQNSQKTTTTTPAAKMADMQNFQGTPYYQASNIEALQQRAAGYATDDATLRRQAETLYNPTYQTSLEALRHQTEQQVQGYKSQIAGIGSAYDQQRQRTNESYNNSAVSLDNALTRRGMGRSSLISTQGAYLENQRNRALGDIDANQAAAVNALNEKVALIRDQAAQQERTLANNYAAQIESRINELRDKNQSAAAQLELNIAQMQQQGYQAYQDWLLRNRAQTSSEEQSAFEREMAEKQLGLQQEQFNWNKELGGRQEERANRQLEQSILESNRNYELNRGNQEFNQQLARDQYELSRNNQAFNQDISRQQLAQSILDSNRNYELNRNSQEYSQNMQNRQFEQSKLESERNYQLNLDKMLYDQKITGQQLAQSILESNRNYELNKANQTFNQDISRQQLAQSILESNRNYGLNERAQNLNEQKFEWEKSKSGGGSGGSSGRSSGSGGPNATDGTENPLPNSDDYLNQLFNGFNLPTLNAGKTGGTGTDTFNNLIKGVLNTVKSGTKAASKAVQSVQGKQDDPNIPGKLDGTHSTNEAQRDRKPVLTSAGKIYTNKYTTAAKK